MSFAEANETTLLSFSADRMGRRSNPYATRPLNMHHTPKHAHPNELMVFFPQSVSQ
jgi:hypothetical protein